MISLSQVTMHAPGFVEPLLHDLTCVVPRGGALTLVGPPGCGKSTALSLIAGGMTPTAGTVRVNGIDPVPLRGGELARHRQSIGYMPQRGALLSNLSLVDNMTLPLRYHRNVSAAEAAAALKVLLRLFEVEDPPAVQTALASPIWCGIAALGRALIMEPTVLVLDDLGEDLDAIDREDLWRLLWRVRVERGLTVLASTTDEAAANTLGDQVLTLPGRRTVNFRILRASSLSLNPYSAETS